MSWEMRKKESSYYGTVIISEMLEDKSWIYQRHSFWPRVTVKLYFHSSLMINNIKDKPTQRVN